MARLPYANREQLPESESSLTIWTMSIESRRSPSHIEEAFPASSFASVQVQRMRQSKCRITASRRKEWLLI